MITGFNTDVLHGGQVYHVQTEDRGLDHPFLESLVYMGGTIIAQKRTSYGAEIEKGASEETIAALLKKQHQVIIAAIKAGRIEELKKFSAKSNSEQAPVQEVPVAAAAPPALPRKRSSGIIAPPRAGQVSPDLKIPASPPVPRADSREGPGLVARSSNSAKLPAPPLKKPSLPLKGAPVKPARASENTAISGRLGLNLDDVISDYLKRSSEQGKLDLKVITPQQFVAGTSVELRVQVLRGQAPEAESVVTIKIIGTAFKPRVYSGRTDRHGNAIFKFALPAFTAGTAALVMEAQSARGRGELKHLIRRS